jgi:hypothetical protein
VDIELEPGEQELGDWTLNYLPPSGGRYTGKLTVTDRRLLFDAKFDTSLTGTLRELVVVGGSYGYLSIPKDRIRSIDVKSSMLKKKVEVTLDDDGVHTFDYGMLSVAKVAEAIRQR